MLGLAGKFTFSRLKVAWDSRSCFSNFQDFNFKKFVLNTGSLIVSNTFKIYVKLTIFLMLSASALNTIVHNYVVPKKCCGEI